MQTEAEPILIEPTHISYADDTAVFGMQHTARDECIGAITISIVDDKLSDLRSLPIEQLWDLYQKIPSSSVVRNRIVEHYETYVISIAKTLIKSTRIHNSHLDDFISEGQFSLLDLVDEYNPQQDAKFETFSYLRIRGAMIDFLRRKLKDSSRSIDAENRNGTSLLDDMEQKQSIEQLSTSEARQLWELVLQDVDEKTRSLIELHYHEGMTLQDAGAELGISKSWASRLHIKFIETLRRRCRDGADLQDVMDQLKATRV